MGSTIHERSQTIQSQQYHHRVQCATDNRLSSACHTGNRYRPFSSMFSNLTDKSLAFGPVFPRSKRKKRRAGTSICVHIQRRLQYIVSTRRL